jgi:hypothetical protein
MPHLWREAPPRIEQLSHTHAARLSHRNLLPGDRSRGRARTRRGRCARAAPAPAHPSVHFAACLRAQLDSDYSRAVVVPIFLPVVSLVETSTFCKLASQFILFSDILPLVESTHPFVRHASTPCSVSFHEDRSSNVRYVTPWIASTSVPLSHVSESFFAHSNCGECKVSVNLHVWWILRVRGRTIYSLLRRCVLDSLPESEHTAV